MNATEAAYNNTKSNREAVSRWARENVPLQHLDAALLFGGRYSSAFVGKEIVS